MKKVLLTIAYTIRGVLGMNVGRCYNWLQVFTARVARLMGMRTGRFAFKYIDAGGHPLRMLICGRGSPTVVFETGGIGADGGPLEHWKRVQPEVSMFTSTVAYDRAGVGLSSPGPKPRDARQIACELHTALGNARVATPYILVGSSFGGPLIRVFAGMFPADVGGMVLVDPAQKEYYNWLQTRDPHLKERQDDGWRDFLASLAQAHESRVPEGIPVVLITATMIHVLPIFLTGKQKKLLNDFVPMWLKFHTEWLEKQPNGKHIITEKSGHAVAFEEPELIVRVIREMVEQARSCQ